MDLISKREILNRLANLKIKDDPREVLADCLRVIEKMPAGYDGNWIYVTERLPEQGEEVLVTECYTETGFLYVEIGSRYGEDENPDWICATDDYKRNPRLHKVIAWMPLPNVAKEAEG